MTASFADNEIWHVLVDSDDMKRMNVEQLDDAFRLSLVDASTLVWKAGMKTWQRLGAVAGLDDEPEDVTRRVPPPPPPPRPAPAPRHLPAPRPAPAYAAAVAPNPFLTGPNPFTANAPNPFAAANPFAATVPSSYPAATHNAFPMTAAAPVLKAPVYTPQLRAPDPYARRAAFDTEVNFRRRSGGFRFGRWLTFGLLLTVGVLALYRQNLLREGARRIGLENKYLYGERRVTAYVDAKAPPALKNVLGRLALLPGPNAIVAKPVAAKPVAPAPAAVAPPQLEAAVATPAAAAPAKPSEGDVKTVSLDSLPVLAGDAAAEASAKTEPPAQVERPVSKAAPQRARSETPKRVEKPAKAVSAKAVSAKAEPKKAEPKKAEPKAAPPPANESFLKAAIRSAIANDGKK